MENLDNYKKALKITEGLNAFESCRELRKLGIDPWDFSLFARALKEFSKYFIDIKKSGYSLEELIYWVESLECEEHIKIAVYLSIEKIFKESNQV